VRWQETALLQAEGSAFVSGLVNVLFCVLAFFFVFMQQKLSCHSVGFVVFYTDR
jgi:hypothetical protein